jgi:dephospho-CoA kinase
LSGRRVVLGIVGMPGSGKSAAAEALREMGIPVVVMGDVVREETQRRGLEPTPQNVGRVMLSVRKEGGSAVVAKRCVPRIEASRGSLVVVEGIRSIDEVNEFRKNFNNFILLAIHSSPETRFERLYHRRRSDDPSSWKTFLERDLRELEVGISWPIALADHVLVNEGALSDLRAEIMTLAKELMG